MSRNFFPKILPFLDNVGKHGTARQVADGNIIRRLPFGGWITEATVTHSEYVVLIFPRQQWLRERASILRVCVRFLSC